MVRRLLLVTSLVGTLAIPCGVGAGLASAAPAPAPRPVKRVDPPALVGLTEVATITPKDAFVDDAVASDGKVLAYLVSDIAGKRELHVRDLVAGTERAPVDVAPLVPQPRTLVVVGDRVLLIGEQDDGQAHAVLVDAAGKAVYKTAPATHLTPVLRDGKTRLALHRARPSKLGTRHELELLAVETGKRVGKVASLELDATGTQPKLDLRVNHWFDGMTVAVGIKGGTWNKKDDTRGPDVEASYDLLSKKLTTTPIKELRDQRKRYEVMAAESGRRRFARLSWDLAEVQLWQDGRPTALELDQPLPSYDSATLVAGFTPATTWISLRVDPTNAEAVRRQKADPAYWDLFEVTGAKAVRRARILARERNFSWGWAGEQLWVLERNATLTRGGVSLTLYRLAP
ncbi:MAG: hypothetical protein KA297_27540 [Kofleriaceae bacterium]|nr:hypothetical protein [Kofleriaceae bacterium]